MSTTNHITIGNLEHLIHVFTLNLIVRLRCQLWDSMCKDYTRVNLHKGVGGKKAGRKGWDSPLVCDTNVTPVKMRSLEATKTTQLKIW